MLAQPILYIRERYHPLFHLRKLAAFRWASQAFDVPVSIRFDLIPHPVAVSLTRNLSFVLSGGKAGEIAERENFLKLVRMGNFQTFYDVGANIGLYGFLFSSVVPNASVTMFEPDESNAELIRRTLKHTSSIRLIEAAASDHDGQITFYKDHLTGATGSIHNEGDTFLAQHHHVEPRSVIVRCVTLDSVVRQSGAVPDFIKIDVEGAELDAFRGAANLLDSARPALFFECDRHRTAARELLTCMGYSLFDFVSLKPVSDVPHNCLALHSIKHANLIAGVSH